MIHGKQILIVMKNYTHTLFAMAMISFISLQSLAQQPELVADINDEPYPTDPANLVNLDGTVYFAVQTYNRGYQLGIYDGTSTEVIYFREGYGSSSFRPQSFVKLGSDIYFISQTDAYGSEVFKYDGNEVTVIDIASGTNGSAPKELIVFNSKIYFQANDNISSAELWEYDGTNATLIEIRPAGNGSYPDNFIVYNDELIFSANDGTNGIELWKYDGTTATMVHNINAGAASSSPNHFGIYDGKLYFQANNGTDIEMWVYDGTTTSRLTDVIGQTVGESPRHLTVYNNELYFNAFDNANGGELWKFDGTNCSLVEDILTGSSGSNPKQLTVATGYLFFEAEGANGRELYRYDGTTLTEFDLNVGAGHSFPNYLTEIGSKLYFSALTPNEGDELWVHDGTNVSVIDIQLGTGSSQPRDLTALNDKLLIRANDGTGKNLWEYDGSNLSMITVSDHTEGSWPEDARVLNGKVYFRAETSEFGAELYMYDGNSISMIDIHPGSEESYPDEMTVIGDKLFFQGEFDATSGTELMIYDGTNLEKIDIMPSGGSSPSDFVEFNGDVYFSAQDGTNGYELWKYDGVEAQMVQDINPTGHSFYSKMIKYGSNLYFNASDGVNGHELWKYDGTMAVMVEDINPGASSSSPEDFYIANGVLYFTATSAAEGKELFKYDGTSVEVIDVNPGSADSYPSYLTEYNGMLYFKANDATNGNQLWQYDGTVASYVDESQCSQPRGLTVHNGLLYFGSDTEGVGHELRAFDGTAVSLAAEIIPGDVGSSVEQTFSFGPMLYVSVYHNDSYFLYRYNGTDAEFVAEMELLEFDEYGAPVELDGYIYFPAPSIEYGGDEMWRIRKTSEETEILTFDLAEATGPAVIDEVNHTIVVETEFGTDLSNLSPIITISDYASISPEGGQPQDFSAPVVYTVTSEFGNQQEWTVSVSAEENGPPTDITIDSNQIDENNDENTVVGIFSTVDPNTSDLHTYSLVAGAGDTDNASFTINNDALLASETFDFETKSSYSIRVQSDDNRGGVFEKEFVIAVNDISGLAQVITIEEIADKLNTDAPFDVVASVNTGLELNYAVDGPATIDGTTITLDGSLGTVTVTVTQAGDADYAAATAQLEFEVLEGRATQTISFGVIDDQFFEEGSMSLSATASSGLQVSFDVVSGPATIDGSVLTFTDIGLVVIQASQEGNAEYQPANSVEQSFNIISITSTAIDNDDPVIRIYPNPMIDNVNIELLGDYTDVTLLDSRGVEVIGLQVAMQQSVPVSHLKPGIYYIKCMNEEGYIIRKIIKQ